MVSWVYVVEFGLFGVEVVSDCLEVLLVFLNEGLDGVFAFVSWDCFEGVFKVFCELFFVHFVFNVGEYPFDCEELGLFCCVLDVVVELVVDCPVCWSLCVLCVVHWFI